MPRGDCLTEAELRALQLGELPEPLLDEVVGHLEACPRCEAAAEAFDRLTDPSLTPFLRCARAPSAAGGLPGRVGEYEVLEEIGRGGMGVVYKARHAQLRRVVALKMLRAGELADREERLRFRAEAEAVARLQHPHVVQIFDVGEWQGGPGGSPLPYFALELVGGGSLAARAAGRPQEPRQAAAWLEPLARAVHYAHSQGVVHRDIKPSNVLLTEDGRPKLCDFGVAKRLEGSNLETRSGQLIGTAEYMAPEQADGRAPVGPAADTYALGAVLYALLTGHPPFRGASPLDTLRQVVAHEPVSPRRLQPEVPRDLETICLKCLHKAPGHRYATAEALADDLRRFLAGEPIVARPVGAAGHLVRWCRRQPALAAAVAGLIGVTLAGFGGVVWQLLRAEAARKVAVAEKKAADTERGNALRLADELRTEKGAAEWQSYRANVAAAASALQLHNAFAARRHLEAAPEKHRGWEWQHFHSRLHMAQAVLPGHEGSIMSLALSPDGTRLLSGGTDRTVRLWDMATRRAVAVLRGHEASLDSVAFSPDGKRLASGAKDGTVRVWDALTGQEVAVLRGDGAADVTFLAFSPVGARLAVGTSDGTGRLWDVAARRAVVPVKDPRTQDPLLALSPDGRLLVAGDSDGTVRLWDVQDDRSLGLLQGHTAVPNCGAFSPDGKRLVINSKGPSSESELRLWDVAGGRPIATLGGIKDQIISVLFSPDGSRIAATGMSGTTRLLDGTTGQQILTLKGHTTYVMATRFSPRGKRLVTASADQTLRLWDVATGECLSVLRGHTAPIQAAVLSQDGVHLASGSNEGTLCFWDLELAERSGVLRGHSQWVFDVAFAPDGSTVLTSGWDGTARLWDATSGRQTGLLPHDEREISSALSPDGTLAATVALDQPVGYLWDVASRTRKYSLSVPSGCAGLARCAFDPKGRLVAAAGSDGPAHLWDAATGSYLATLRGHTGHTFGLAFSPDGTLLVTCGSDATVRLWDVAARQELAVLRGHTGRVYVPGFSPDGRLLATGGLDRSVRLWDCRRAPRCSISPSGRPLLACGSAPTARGWRPPAGTTRSDSGTWRRARRWPNCAGTGPMSRRSPSAPTAHGWHRARSMPRRASGTRSPPRPARGPRRNNSLCPAFRPRAVGEA